LYSCDKYDKYLTLKAIWQYILFNVNLKLFST
jgi:hypothetical protein